MTLRIARAVAVIVAAGLAIALLHLLGVDVGSWFESLFDALTAVDPGYVVLGLVFQTLDTALSGIAWIAILRAAYPDAGIKALPILTAYAVAVAGNDVLPASLGTLVMLVMLATLIPGATFPGLIGGQVVHKLFFVVAGAFVYLYLFLSVPGSFAAELELLDNHRALALLVPAVLVVVGALVVRAFWSRLRGLWQRAKQGGAILSEPRAYVAKVLIPEIGAWFCKLAVIAVFLAAYSIPVTFHTVMTVAGGQLAGERRLRHPRRGGREPGRQLRHAHSRGRRSRDRRRLLRGPAAHHDGVECWTSSRARRRRVRLVRRQDARRLVVPRSQGTEAKAPTIELEI